MTSKKIYLIRHGQTDYNKQGIVQGSGIDSDLNETGMLQAEAFYSHYGKLTFDKIYTSQLKRSQQSVNRFISSGIPHESLESLNEINWGNREGTKITIEEDQYYKWLLHQWQSGKTSIKIEGGESPEDVARRQVEALDHLINRVEEKNVLICMHGRAMRVLLCQLLNYPLNAMDIFEHSNMGLYLMNFTGRFYSIEKYNSTEHYSQSK